MARVFSAIRSSVSFFSNPVAPRTKHFAVVAAAIATIAGASRLGHTYGAATFALWGAAYLFYLIGNQTKEPAQIKRHVVTRASTAPTALRSVGPALGSHSTERVAPKMQENSRSGVIYFYDHTNPATEWMGNFYEMPIRFNQLTFRNAEAAFQAQKFIHHPRFMQRFTTLSGDQAFHLARNNVALIRSDWKQVNIQTMANILEIKAQNPEIARWLLSTGSAYLVEHNPVKGRDAVWSDDNDGSGQNILGKLWMERRAALGGSGIVSKVAIPLVSVNTPRFQQIHSAAQNCLAWNCSRPRLPGGLFCSIVHGKVFELSYLQQKSSDYDGCEYPNCALPRAPGFDYCGRSHGVIMEDWKRKNDIY